MTGPGYPWFDLVTGDDLEQGDLLDSYPIFLPPDDLEDWEEGSAAFFTTEERNLVVISQSCDLVKGREKVSDVLLCPVWPRSRYKANEFLGTPKGLEDARRGILPGVHLLSACTLPDFDREVRVVDFRQVYTLPLGFVRMRAAAAGPRLRLLPPYREHLAQAFDRYFMRIGLPTDIPPFK
ncbi:MAG TPA: hypothetical protein VMZ71_06730 [Gemmataceae bacterium]|nr:hypothetical protein [Gemmataceae bacterium]